MPVRLSFDRVAATYDETRALSPKVMAHVLGILVDQLLGKHVLEVGVGTGRYAVPLQKSGIDVVGVDISHKMVELGLGKGLRNVVLADGARLPFTARGFDLATTNHVLHLVPDWREVLLEIVRVTRDSYFSILERSGRTTNLHREYDRLAADAGYTWSPPGLHERNLPDILPPDLVMPVGPFEDVVPADLILEGLEQRSFSSQWGTPEKIHRQVMRELRHRWSGHEFKHTYSLEISFWRVEHLAELARKPAQRS
ncbi:MAG TPA: methyltransferase domain-containing protein [Thermoplasmata archaeon]|nr:methyltransferase domain-containing protein [Thermoplasmata archaeon]